MTYGTTTYQERSIIIFFPSPPGPSKLALRPSQLALRPSQLALRPPQLALRPPPAGSEAPHLAPRLTLLDPRPSQRCSFLRGSHSLFGDPPNGI